LADPKEGPDPTETSLRDLFWEATVNGLSSRYESPPIIAHDINIVLNIFLITTTSAL
jgi:hypothetical protein